MSSVVSTVLQIAVLIGLAYVAIVGAVGAALSRSRGGTLSGGFWRSGFLPLPLGWIWVAIATRKSRRPSQNSLVDEFPLSGGPDSVPTPRRPVTTTRTQPAPRPRPVLPTSAAGPHDY